MRRRCCSAAGSSLIREDQINRHLPQRKVAIVMDRTRRVVSEAPQVSTGHFTRRCVVVFEAGRDSVAMGEPNSMLSDRGNKSGEIRERVREMRSRDALRRSIIRHRLHFPGSDV